MSPPGRPKGERRHAQHEACLASRAARGWAAVALVLALAALLGFARVSPETIDWQPARAGREPWRAFTAVAVHYSALHLAANLAGALVVAAFGAVAQVPARAVLAWLVAWPLTQVGLLLRPDLAHYGGLSGVLHAGVAVVALHLVAAGPARRRRVGLAVLAGLLLKLSLETPWGPALVRPSGWDIAVAPFAHVSGTVAGLVCAGIALAVSRRCSSR